MRRPRPSLRIIGLLGALVLGVAPAGMPPAAAATDTVGATSVVERFHETLLGVMKEAKTLGVKGRYRRLEPAVDGAFDLALMIRIASGSFWRAMDEPARERLVAAFRRYSVATYAAQFNGHSGQTFETLGTKPGQQRTTLVETRLLDPGEKPVGLVYVLREGRAGWSIVDVLVDKAISELAVRRSEYQAVLTKEGAEGLIRTLAAKADELLTE